MILTWYGGSCVLVEERPRGGVPRVALFFPETKTSRARTLEEKAQVTIRSGKPLTGKDKGFFIVGSGEYDVAGFAIRGVSLGGGTVAYVLESEGTVFCFFGSPAPDQLEDKELEAIGDVDVVGMRIEKAGDVAAFKEAISAIEPRAAIPLAQDVKIRTLLSKELGVSDEGAPKFIATVKELPQEGFRVVFLDAQ